MQLFKYRSLRDFEFVVDIIVNERLHCSPYEQLNDPFEGLFNIALHEHPSFQMPPPIPNTPNSFLNLSVVTSISDFKDKFEWLEEIRICSLSSSSSDVRLWSHYADGHKGIVIAIDFTGLESEAHKVSYSKALPKIGNAGRLSEKPFIRKILSRKTYHWAHEEEYRVINEAEYFSIEGKITQIFAGPRVDMSRLQLLEKIAGDKNIPIMQTTIDEGQIKVVPVRVFSSLGNK